MNKRGLSAVVVLLLLILIAIAPIAILWNVLKGIFTTSSQDVGFDRIFVDLQTKENWVVIDHESDSVQIKIKRNKGEGNLSGIAFVFESADSSWVYTARENLPKVLEEKTFTIDFAGKIDNIVRIKIVPLVTEKEKENYGIEVIAYGEEGDISGNGDNGGGEPGGVCYTYDMSYLMPGFPIDTDCQNWGSSGNTCIDSIPSEYYDEAGKFCPLVTYSNCVCSNGEIDFNYCTTDIKHYAFSPENLAPNSYNNIYGALADVSLCGACPDNELDGTDIQNSCGMQESNECEGCYISGAVDYRIIDCIAGDCSDMSATGQLCGMVPEGWTGINSFCQAGDRCYHDNMDDNVLYPDPDCASYLYKFDEITFTTNVRYFGFCKRDV